MSVREIAPVRVQTQGRVPNGTRELAAAKVGSLLRIAAEPALQPV
jgi:hypothetical protein